MMAVEDLLHQKLELADLLIEGGVSSDLKVVHLCSLDYGGAGKAAYRLHKGLQSIGMQSTMLVMDKKTDDSTVKVISPKHTFRSVWKRWESLLSQYPKRPERLEIFTDTLSDIRLDLAKEINEADIINLHWVAGLLDYACAHKILEKKPVVWTLHDMNPFTGGCHYAGDCNKYTDVCGACPQLGSDSTDDLANRTWKQKREAYPGLGINVVTPSRWLTRCAQVSALLSGFPIKVIPYGLNVDVFRPYRKKEVRELLGIPKSYKVILFGADYIVNKRKGFKYLMEAINGFSSSEVREDVLLALFGGLPAGVNLSSKYPYLNFGPIADEDYLAKVYSAADVFVIPTLEDNLPNTVLEAMACGTPVVGFETGGLPDMIEHKKTGFLAEPGDIKGVVEGLRWVMLLDDKGEVFKRCREKATREYALQIQASAYRDLYENILKNHRYSLENNDPHGSLHLNHTDNSKEADKLNEQGEVLYNRNDIQGALVYFSQAIDIAPNHATAHNNLGVSYWESGDVEKAVMHFTKTLEIDPDYRDAILNLRNVLKDLRRCEAAKNIYSSYLKRNPNDREITEALEICLVRDENESEAGKNEVDFGYQDSCELVGDGSSQLHITPDNFSFFSYSKRSHFAYFRDHDLALYRKKVDPGNCDLKVYQDLLVYNFILENIPKGSRILEIGGGNSRVLSVIGNDYECWNIDKLEGRGDGPTHVDASGYRLVKAYMGEFCTELPDQYFDFVFSISALEHVGDEQRTFRNICCDIDRVLKPGGYSLHCFDILIKGDAIWTNDLLPYMFEDFETINAFVPFETMRHDGDLYFMTRQAYVRCWESITKTRYEDFGKPVSYNILWRKKDERSKPESTRLVTNLDYHVDTTERDTGSFEKVRTDSLTFHVRPAAPKISIVTPSYNQRDFLEECIESILSQDYPNLEYIIMDGGSADGSVEIIKKYERFLTHWRSAPDAGQYAAINEGFRMATGDIMTWLNSDDKHHPDSLFKAAFIFEKFPSAEWVTGRPTAWNEKGELVLVFDELPLWARQKYLNKFFKKICIQQESTFWRATLWRKAGAYLRTDLEFAGDLELWIRFFRHAQLYTIDTLFGGYRYQPNQKPNLFMNKYIEEGERIIDQEIENIHRGVFPVLLPAPPPISFDECSFNDYRQSVSRTPQGADIPIKANSIVPRTARRAPVTIATSIAPREIEKQKRAIQSWMESGFNVVSVNCKEEIEIVRETFPEVHFLQAKRDARESLGKPFIYLDDLLAPLKDADSEICGIVNSDIHLMQDKGFISFVHKEASDSLVYIPRVDVNSLESLEGEVYDRGFDVFFFPQLWVSRLPESDFCLGAPWWDYWVPLNLSLKGYLLKRLISPVAFHLKHPCAFTNEQWMLYGKKLSAYLHENLVQTSGLNPSSEPWSKFLIDFSSYIHFHLSDLAKHQEEEAQLIFRYCQCLARHILGYLESNSMPLKYQGHDKPRDIPDHLRVQLVNEAILQVRQLMNEGQFEKALNRLDLALERFPHATDLIALRSGLGRSIEEEGENHTWNDTSNGNIQSLECRVIDAPRGQKTEAERLNRQGEALVATRRIEDAWGKFIQALKHDPDYAPAHNNLGVLHWQKGDVQAALDRFLTAVEIDPNDRDTILSCGEVLRSLDRIEHAKGIYSSYLERNPHDEEIGKQLSVLEAEARTGLMCNSLRSPKIVLYALRELHLPVLLPIYRELIKWKAGQVGFMAPPFQVSQGGLYQEGLSEEAIKCLREDSIPFWGHEKTERYACVVTADFCYDRVDGWGPIVCVGHGTISKGIYFTSTPRSRIENYATVLCVPGPWHKDSFGDQVFTRIEPTGFSKMDELHRLQPSDKGGIIQSIGFSPDKTTILFAPTYNPVLTSMGMLFEQWKNLDPEKYQVIFKLHGAAEAEWTDRYERLAASQQNFHYAPESSIMPYMYACDVLVSDVSSAYVEFLVLDKPIILVNNPEMGRYPGFHPDNIEYQVRDAAYQIDRAGELHNVLQQLEAEDPKSQKRTEYAAKLFPPLDGQSSRRIAAQIMSVVQGEIALQPPPGKYGMRVYIPTRIRCLRQIEENIERAQFPVELFSHNADMEEIGGLPVHHLGQDEVPPPPFICMIGEFVLPKQWDYLWLLMEHFTDVRGLFGPVLPDGHENLDQQHSLLHGKLPDLSEEHLQSVYKFYLCNVESIRPVKTLKADGLIVTEGIDHDLLKAWLHRVHDPTEAAHFADEVRRLGHSVGVLESYYGYSKHEVDTGRLEAPKDGNLAVDHSEKMVDDRVSEPAFERSPSRTEGGGYLVSAIVSTYNAGQFIRGCLEDLEAQTISDRLEIVVVDSASEQNEGEIVREFQQKYPNIKYIRTDQRESIYAAWNRGIRASSGKYITNANTDDRHRKDALETLSGVLDARDDIAVVYGNQLITQVPNQTFDTVTPSGKFEWPKFDRDTLLEYCCVGPQPMWRRSIHDGGHIYFDESLEVVGDYEFWLNVSQRYRLKRIDGFLGIYYRSPENHNREFTDLHQSRTESYHVRRRYYLKTVESLPPEVLKSRITDMSMRIERCLSDVGAGGLSKEAKRHLEHLFWRVCVLFELYGDIDNSRKIARRYFDIANDGYMLAFHLKELACKAASDRAVDTGPLVSVIIPTFNSEQYITDTIQSVLNQTYKNYEVLIVDDGSQDETLAIMKGLRERSPEKITKILEQENRGPSTARNRGIVEARGELILTLDADDQISYDYLEKGVSEFQRDPSIDVVFTEAVFYGHKNKIWALKDVSVPDLFMRNQVNVTALFRKQCWAGVAGYDENLPGYEDWDLWISLAKEKCKFFRIPEPLFFYRHKRRSRGYLSAQKDVEKKIAIMRKHPDIYRFPAQEEISMLYQFQLIPLQFLKWKQEEKIKLPAVGSNERTDRGKILFVVHDFPPYRSAGAQLFAKNLAQKINSRGIFEVDVLHPVFREAHREKYVISEKEYEGLRVFELTKEQSLEPQKIFHQGVANAFQRFLQTHQYDLIHFHGLGQLSLSPVHVARMMGLKTVMTLHDYWFLCDHWHLTRKNQDLCSGPESVEKCANCYLEDHSLEKTADNMGAATNYHSFRKQSFSETFSLLNKVFAPSQYTRDFFKKYGLDGVEHNPNGIDYTPKQYERKKQEDQPLVFGYAGQIIKRKGVNLLIEAFKQIPDPDIRLHLWGRINEKYKYGRNIRELMQSDERITWFGGYTPQQLESIFEAMDVAVVPSLMDNYPIILQEAFVHKTPVIASKTGGIPELVSHEHNALLTEPGSVDDLREKMKAIVQRPELIEEFRANIPPQKTLQEDAEFHLETYRALLNDGENKVPGERVTVQFYVLKSVHWPMFENLYYFLKDRTDVKEIIICLPDLSFIGNGLAEKLLSLDATFVSNPRAKRVDVTFIADTIAGKVKGCGKIVNVGHGTISKGYYFTDSPWTEREDWVDLLCVPGAYAREKCDRILTTKVAATGMPKLDPVFSGKYDREHLCRLLNLDPDKRIILYAPTFNQDLSSVSVFAERFAELAKPDRYILIKLHGSTAPDQTTKYQQLAERHENIVFIHESNIAPYIGGADVMISDVSSAYMEFMALDKPVILYNNPNCHRYHGYDPKDIEYQWRDLGTQVASFDELKVQLEEIIQFGDDRSAVRMGYARELFADLEGNASARVWNETTEVLRSHDRLINIPTISIVMVITDDNLFAVRAQVHNLQFYSVMPLELILVNQSQSREIRDFIETTRRYGQFLNVMTVEIGQAVNKDDAGLAGMKKATGDFVIYLQDNVILYKNFDYIAYKTFKWNPEVEALTGVSNLPVKEIHFETYIQRGAEVSFSRFAYDFINRYQAKEIADLSLSFLPPFLAFRRGVFALEPCSDFEEFKTQISKNQNLKLCLSLFYATLNGRDLKLIKDFWSTRFQMPLKGRIDLMLKFLPNYGYPEIAELLLDDLLAMGTPKKDLLRIVARSFSARYYDVPYKSKIIKLFGEFNDLAEMLRREIALIEKVSTSSKDLTIRREALKGHKTAHVPKRVLFYFFKNVHIPILIPIYQAMKRLHPEAAVGFGYMHHAPQMRAGFTAEELRLLESYGEKLYDVPQRFKPDITFIADSVYPWTQNCGKLVNVGHGVLSKGQYYTDTLIARREEQADLVCVPGIHHERIVREVISRPVVTTGMAKLDGLFSGRVNRASVVREFGLPQNHNRFVLFAPTFNDELSSIPFVLDRINEVIPGDQTLLIIKLHGSTEESYRAMYGQLSERDQRVIYAKHLDISPFLALCDVMVSDVSSAMMEFAALDKPLVLFNNPNWHTYPNYNPNDIEFLWRDIGIQVHDLNEMKEAVKESLGSPGTYSEKRRFYTDQLFANKYDGKASERIIEHAFSLLR